MGKSKEKAMGCGASASGGKKLKYEYRLVVVDYGAFDEAEGGSPDDGTARIDVYSLKRFHRAISYMPNSPEGAEGKLQGFSVAIHPHDHLLYITGGIVPNTQTVLKHSVVVDMSMEEYVPATLSPMPKACSDHLSVVCCQDHGHYLYVFNADDSSFRLNLATNVWEVLKDVPLSISNVNKVRSYKNVVAFLTKDNMLLSYAPPSADASLPWTELFMKTLPGELSAVSDEYIYSLSPEDKQLYRTHLENAACTAVPEVEGYDGDMLVKSFSMNGMDGYLFFVGTHYSNKHTSVTMVDLNKNRCVVEGHLETDTSSKHAVYICKVALK